MWICFRYCLPSEFKNEHMNSLKTHFLIYHHAIIIYIDFYSCAYAMHNKQSVPKYASIMTLIPRTLHSKHTYKQKGVFLMIDISDHISEHYWARVHE